ncbi:aldehyde dehydrogenase family protein [Paraburkholderia sp. GV068]|uniref:aldehyde dehydrogenase family protein n=1 Tax=Paraburkholderia TaxID=1822464 RepID=UPI0035C149B5
MKMRNELYIDGKWVKSIKGATCDVINPATEEVIQTISAASAEDVDIAVKAARRAFDHDGWPKLSGAQRAKYLRAIANGIRSRHEEIARLETIDNGKPFPEAMWDIGDAAGCFEYYAGLAEQLDNNPEEKIELSDGRFTSKAVKEPIGVAGAIIPWNYPLLMAAWKVAPALAAGCTVVLKPAELTSLTALELGAIAHEAELPAGVLNILTGSGSVTGQAITEHKGVDKLAFTGSGPIGSQIMATAARDIKRISLELGGKSPFVVFDDADIEQAVEWIMFGIFWNQGQVCSATSRVLVQKGIYDKLLERLVEETNRITVGNGLDDGVLLGPLVSRRQYRQVAAAIEAARDAGATVAAGGTRPEGFDKGYYLRPTILTDVPLDSDAWVEEIFGPVVCVRPFETEHEAVQLANDSRFGLAAAVMSKDDARAERVAAALRAGIVWINCSQPTFTEAPWGGYKQSGIGRELGRWGLDNYLETKQITKLVSEEPWGWYIK